MGGSVSCGTFMLHQEARVRNQVLMGDLGKICRYGFGKGILQTKDIVGHGYMAAGGKGFRLACKGPEGQSVQDFLW